MSHHFTITLAQLNPTVGDIPGNIEKIKDVYAKHKQQADLIVFTEMGIVGYPPDDLILKPAFIDRVMKERYLKKNTILVNLQNPKYFKKNKDKKYTPV